MRLFEWLLYASCMLTLWGAFTIGMQGWLNQILFNREYWMNITLSGWAKISGTVAFAYRYTSSCSLRKRRSLWIGWRCRWVEPTTTAGCTSCTLCMSRRRSSDRRHLTRRSGCTGCQPRQCNATQNQPVKQRQKYHRMATLLPPRLLRSSEYDIRSRPRFCDEPPMWMAFRGAHAYVHIYSDSWSSLID